MKNILIIALLIVLAIWTWNYYQRNVIDYSMEEILPKNVLIYLKVNDANSFFRSLNNNETWKMLRTLDYDKLVKTTPLSIQQKMFLKLIQFDFSKFDSRIRLLLSKIFSDNFALVVYPPKNVYEDTAITLKQYMSELSHDVFANVVLIAKVPFDIKNMNIIAGPLKKYNDKFQIEVIPYKDKTYLSLTLSDKGQKFFYAHLRKYVIISFDEEIIKDCIDTYFNQTNQLAQDKEFVKISEKYLKQSDLLGYVHVSSFWDFFKKNSDKILELSREQILQEGEKGVPVEAYLAYYENLKKKVSDLIEKGKGFKSFAMSLQMGKVSSLIFSLFLDENPLNSSRVNDESCLITENESIHFIPKDILAYQWNSCFNFMKIWNGYKDVLSNNNKASEKLDKVSSFEKIFNLDIENDIVPALGNEIGGYIKNINFKDNRIFPELLFFVSAGNQEQFLKLYDSLDNVSILSFQSENYQGYPIKFIRTPFGEIFKPSVCRLDNYLLISLTEQLIKDSVDSFLNKSGSVLDNRDFEKVNRGLTNKNKVVKFIQLHKFSQKIADALEWMDGFFIRKEMAREAFKKGTEKRLADIVEKISLEEQEIGRNELRVNALEKEIDAISIGDDEGNIKDKEADISFLEDNTKKRRKKLEGLDEQREELRVVLRGYSKKSMLDKQARRTLLDTVALPLLKSFESIRSIGERKTQTDQLQESFYFISSQ